MSQPDDATRSRAAAMNLLQLSLVLQGAPDRSELWTQFELDVRDEYDRRIVAAEQAGRAA